MVNETFDSLVKSLSQEVLTKLQSQLEVALAESIQREIGLAVRERLGSVDISSVVRDHVALKIGNGASSDFFPDNSIPGSAIDKSSLNINGDLIRGGTITNFASTGIDDKSSQCQLTILDNASVFENTIYASGLQVKGDVVVEGTLTAVGGIPQDSQTFKDIVSQVSNVVTTAIGPGILDQFQDRIYERIATEGIDLNKIKVGGQDVIDGRTLTSAITDSSLQTVGMLRDLQTQGETLLSETLYTTKKRVGINTMEPSSALSIWDEEVEIGIGKQSQNTARFATPRNQSLILGSGQKNNITLTPDGVAIIPTVQIGNMQFTSSPTPPNFDAPKGSVIFNENPSVGGPLGWVSLGDARWANFGIID